MNGAGFPAARRVTISSVRGWSAGKFRKLEEPLLVEYHSAPVAVVLPYAEFLRMQAALEAVRVPHMLERAAAETIAIVGGQS